MWRKIICLVVSFSLFLVLSINPLWCEEKTEKEVKIAKLKKFTEIDFRLSSYKGQIKTTFQKPLSSPGVIIDSIWHDFQQDFSPAYMMAYDTLRKASHFTWMAYTEGGQRFTYYNYVDSSGWLGSVQVCICSWGRCGHPWIDLLPDGRAVLFFHHTQSEFFGSLGIDQGPGMGQFRIYDLPDSLPRAGLHGMFPNGAIDNKGYIHIIMTDETSISPLAYTRCYEDTSNFNLICESPGIGTYIIPPDSLMPSSQAPAVFDSVGGWWAGEVVACSPVSDKVAIVYGGMLSGLSDTSEIDVLYVESTNNGQDWIDYGIPERTNLTNFADDDTLGLCWDFSALYDYDDNLHIFFHTYYYNRTTGEHNFSNISLWHWSQITETPCGKFNLIGTTNWKSYNNWDPLQQMRYVTAGLGYIPENRNHLYCVWAQLDTGDVAANGLTNSEIYASISTNSGVTWDTPVNLTNSHSPGCEVGECESDIFPSISRNVSDFLHIQYINDKKAGLDWGTTLNPIMYLKYPIWTPPAVAKIEWTPEDYVWPYIGIPNHSYLDTTLLLENNGYVSLTGSASSSASWIQISNGSFNITEGWCYDIDLRFDATTYQETLLVDSIRIASNDGFGNDTLWVPVQLIVSDQFYLPEFVVLDNNEEYGSIRISESNVGNLGNKNDTAGIYLFDYYPYENLLHDGSVYLGTINSEDDSLVTRWLFDEFYFLPETSLAVDTIPELNTIIITSRFFPFIPGSVLGYIYWWSWMVEAKEFMFYSQNTEEAPEEFLILKQIRLYHDSPPSWWPDFSPLSEVLETYLGMALDFDCPYYYTVEPGNHGGFDSTLGLIYIQGYGSPEDEIYLAGMACLQPPLGDSFWQGLSQPYCGHVLNDSSFDGSQEPWWENSNFYYHISSPGYSIPDPDSVADYSCLMTAAQIPAHTINSDTFEVSMAIAVSNNGPIRLKQTLKSAKCGNVNRDSDVTIADVVSIVNYLFKGGDVFLYMSDMNGDCLADIVDAVYLVNYLFRGGPRPQCSCGN